ncbi:pyridoxamine 5'-phosphate oxidase family protein [Saccharopolyspora sp. CA-218241]|uniref:pyridoxamine 5'-phosphate oxidase family protein n=1 Tax=Saccharopolyspora sp. CA-218241 TaxID=3240027 RepID=UPI003D9959A2
MVTWQEFEGRAPDMAAAVRARLTAHRHHVLATLRADGSPRVSGTELDWRGTDLVLGSMPRSRKALDLRRDGRCAVHADPADELADGPDCKLAGTAVEVTGAEHREWVAQVRPPSADSHLFRLDLAEVVTTGLSPERTHLVIRRWTPDRGIEEHHRT